VFYSVVVLIWFPLYEQTLIKLFCTLGETIHHAFFEKISHHDILKNAICFYDSHFSLPYLLESEETIIIIVIYYLKPLESGGGYVLAPSFRPSIRPNYLSALLLCNYWLEFNFMGIINITRKCAYHQHLPIRPLNSKLWPLISYEVCM
jgi:hypothetical protein